jgi:type III pantothenate kinase
LQALSLAAAALPHVDVSKPAQTIGTNTVACMQSGVYWGYIGLIEGITRQIRLERDVPMKVIATGGLAPLFQQGTEIFDAIEDDLTIHGLVLINELNKERDTA